MVPEGEKNPGTGRHRQYPISAIADARLLSVLTDAIGIQATKARTFAEAFGLAKNWLSAEPHSRKFLIIGLSLGGELTGTKLVLDRSLQTELNKSAEPVHILIDLWKVFQNQPEGS